MDDFHGERKPLLDLEVDTQNTLAKPFWQSRRGSVLVGISLLIASIGTVSSILDATRRVEQSETLNTSSCDEAFTEYEHDSSMCNDLSSPVIQGFDVVSYFDSTATDGIMGSPDYTVSYRGYTFNFANAENAATFQRNPSAFAPKYGGFCALGLSGADPMNANPLIEKLYRVPSDPSIFSIIGGSLYLFRGEGAKTIFLDSLETMIAGADATWANWFGDQCDGFYNTMCFYDQAE